MVQCVVYMRYYILHFTSPDQKSFEFAFKLHYYMFNWNRQTTEYLFSIQIYQPFWSLKSHSTSIELGIYLWNQSANIGQMPLAYFLTNTMSVYILPIDYAVMRNTQEHLDFMHGQYFICIVHGWIIFVCFMYGRICYFIRK